MYRRPESVLVVVYTEALEFLVLQRADMPEFWQSVTGSLEAGETPEAAAERELFEETGLVCRSLVATGYTNSFSILPQRLVQYEPGVTHNTEHVFHARFEQRPETVALSDEHLQAEWLNAADAISRIWSETNRDALLQLARLLAPKR